MNFFQHQQLARRNSRVMGLLFILSVAVVIVAVDLVAAAIYLVAVDDPAASFASVPRQLLVGCAVVTFLVIFVVSLVNIVRLAGGGEKVAKMMGAREVAPNTQDRLERRLRNIVEEMAIASGVRMPRVYIVDSEKGINAFAAGWTVSGAVVAVTRGALDTLTRDELQGVIGHEFSHILNGDMGLNIRMIGVLAGIVAIGSIGGFAMRSAFEVDDIRGAIPIFLVGLALFVVGYTGLFFARLIKAAVSRQREFLADASSVQFTRNPDGMAGALDQARRAGATLIQGRYAEEMSHMFFGQSVKLRLAGLFETHPPIAERIRRVHPGFQLSVYRPRREAALAAADAPSGAAGLAASEATAVPPAGRRRVDKGMAWKHSADESAQLVGAMQGAKVEAAGSMLAALPPGLRENVREPDDACAAIVALLLAPKREVMQEQLAALKAAGLDALAANAAAAAPLTRLLGVAFHLPVIDLALPAVKAAPEAAKKQLLAALEMVINADRRISLHEFVVLTLMRHQLAPAAKPQPATRKLAELRSEAMAVLSLVAHAGTRADAVGARGEALRLAMAAGTATLGLTGQAVPQLSVNGAAAALEALKRLAPLEKARLVKGLFATVTADGTIRVGEAELMRLIGAVLDCPLPPMLDEIDPAALAA